MPVGPHLHPRDDDKMVMLMVFMVAVVVVMIEVGNMPMMVVVLVLKINKDDKYQRISFENSWKSHDILVHYDHINWNELLFWGTI